MGRYGFRNNKFTTNGLDAVGELNVLKDSHTTKAVSYIKLQSCAVGTASSKNRYAYLFLGTAGELCISSTSPTGTTGNFSNIGYILGTSE